MSHFKVKFRGSSDLPGPRDDGEDIERGEELRWAIRQAQFSGAACEFDLGVNAHRAYLAAMQDDGDDIAITKHANMLRHYLKLEDVVRSGFAHPDESPFTIVLVRRFGENNKELRLDSSHPLEVWIGDFQFLLLVPELQRQNVAPYVSFLDTIVKRREVMTNAERAASRAETGKIWGSTEWQDIKHLPGHARESIKVDIRLALELGNNCMLEEAELGTAMWGKYEGLDPVREA